MSILKRLFGGGDAPEPEKTEHAGFRITPTPIKESGGFRICAVIEKEIDGEAKSHRMIRADTVSGKDEADTASINKARQLIDQMGDQLFG